MSGSPTTGTRAYPTLDEVWTYPLGSSVNRSAALLAGNVDYAQTVDPAAYELIRNNPRFSGQFEGQPFSSYSYFAIYFNMDREPWNDPKVRRAMWLAIDRDALHEDRRRMVLWLQGRHRMDLPRAGFPTTGG